MYQFGVGSLFAKFADGSSVEFGTLQDCNVDFSFDKKELYVKRFYKLKSEMVYNECSKTEREFFQETAESIFTNYFLKCATICTQTTTERRTSK